MAAPQKDLTLTVRIGVAEVAPGSVTTRLDHVRRLRVPAVTVRGRYGRCLMLRQLVEPVNALPAATCRPRIGSMGPSSEIRVPPSDMLWPSCGHVLTGCVIIGEARGPLSGKGPVMAAHWRARVANVWPFAAWPA